MPKRAQMTTPNSEKKKGNDERFWCDRWMINFDRKSNEEKYTLYATSYDAEELETGGISPSLQLRPRG